MEFEEQKIVIDLRRCDVLLNSNQNHYHHTLGRKYALLIGLDYLHTKKERKNTKGPIAQEHIYAWEDALLDYHDVEREDIDILLDDPRHVKPTKDNIIKALEELKEKSRCYKQVIVILSGLNGPNGGLLCLNEEEITKDELELHLVSCQDRHANVFIFTDLYTKGSLLNLSVEYNLNDKKWIKHIQPNNHVAKITLLHPSEITNNISGFLNLLLVLTKGKPLNYLTLLEKLDKSQKSNTILSYSGRDFNGLMQQLFTF